MRGCIDRSFFRMKDWIIKFEGELQYTTKDWIEKTKKWERKGSWRSENTRGVEEEWSGRVHWGRAAQGVLAMSLSSTGSIIHWESLASGVNYYSVRQGTLKVVSISDIISNIYVVGGFAGVFRVSIKKEFLH